MQKQHEDMNAFTMLNHLKALYDKRARNERYDISQELFHCKMEVGSSVATHVLKMIGLIEKLEKLGFMLHHQLSVDLILQSLPPSFSNFVMNFNLTQVETSTLPELLNMLKTAEDSIKKEKGYVLMVEPSKKRKFKSGPKKTIKKAFKPTDKIKKEKKPKGTCFHCGKDGHWKRNCKAYLESLKEKKLNEASTSGMFMIEINLSTAKSDSWVLDTRSGSHICINMQCLKKSRKLAKGEVGLRVGNGARVVALAIGIYTLSLPSGLILDLKDCYFVPALTKNIISISCLDLDDFMIITKNKSCSLYLADVFYGAGHLTNGLYILDLENPVFNINTKQPKIDDLRNSYLWHCRLGHINDKPINKLYKNGYLGSFDYESFDTCESCLLGKMTKTPFIGKGERSTELLSLIHTDVCGPMSTQGRNGFSYFLTFTDDHSRYGHVYLLKYK